MATPGEVTQLLLSLQAGDQSVVDRLTAHVYSDLRRLAGAYFRRERPDHTLQPTALVNEAYVRVAGQSQIAWQSRAHFLGIAARVMRQILVDHSRAHGAGKRGSGLPKEALDEAFAYSNERGAEVVALDDALEELARIDPRKAQVIELRFFGGLTGEEIAEVAGISTATVARELKMAQAWLARELRRPDARA